PSCPSDGTLTGLLADALTTAERDRLARHVEGCAPCQEKLARLTRTPDTEMWRRAEPSPQGTDAEEGLVRRLKQASAAHRPGQAGGPAGVCPGAGAPTPAAVASDRRAVPGFEILGERGRGGMGIVYKARQLPPSRLVALKMVLAGDSSAPARRARFLAEGDA